MMQGRGKTTSVSMAVLALCVLTLALPVAAQVTSPALVYNQVRHTALVATMVTFSATHVSEPAGLALFGVALTLSVKFARRRHSS